MDNSPARFVAEEIRDGIRELHADQSGPCDGHHHTFVVSYVEFIASVKPGKPLTRPQRRAIYERVAQVCWGSGCPAYRLPAQVLWQLAAELEPQPRRKRPDSGA